MLLRYAGMRATVSLMFLRYSPLFMLLTTVLFVAGCQTPGKPFKPGGTTSLASIVVMPDRYVGEYVIVVGYLHRSTLFLSDGLAAEEDDSSSIDLLLRDEDLKSPIADECRERYVTVFGPMFAYSDGGLRRYAISARCIQTKMQVCWHTKNGSEGPLTQGQVCRPELDLLLRPNTWLQPTAVDLVASLPAPTVPSLRSAAAEPKR